MILYADLHMHSTVSDGTDIPLELLRKAREAGIKVFSLTDHDAVTGCREIREHLAPDDPVFINGIEFSCRDEFGKYHILGYDYDPAREHIGNLTAKAHAIRIQKVKRRLDLLKDQYGYDFSEEDIRMLLALPNPGKPHIANLMVKNGYASSPYEAFTSCLNKTHVEGENICPEEAIRAIHASGGIAVLAHPITGSGREHITGEALRERIVRLKGFGLDGLEAYYSTFDREQTDELLAFADDLDLLVTAGSDYHGANKKVRLGDTGSAYRTDGGERIRKFLERAGAAEEL